MDARLPARLALCLALASAVAFGALACGGASDTPDPAPAPDRTAATAAAEPTAEPTPPPTAEPTKSAEPTPPTAEPTPEPALSLLRQPDAHGYRGLIYRSPIYRLSGYVSAAAWLDRDRMYVASLLEGIRLVDVGTGEVETVLEGLVNPQGLTVLDGRLYVTDMGNACAEMALVWDGGGCIAPYPDLGAEVLLPLLSRVSTRILSYAIDESGGLSDERLVVDRIMSINRDHSPNGLANDGEYVYVSIGHPEGWVNHGTGGLIVENAEALAAAGRRTDLMGVVARFRPEDALRGEVEVFATGLRNTYGISVGPGGTIWGADNDQHDGLTTSGNREELNAIVEGGFYGFPFWGTLEAPPEANVTEPVAVLQGTGSTKAYANEDGVYVAYLSLGPEGEEQDNFVVDRFDYETYVPTRIFRNARSFVVDILERDGLLYLVEIRGCIHIIDPRDAPIEALGTEDTGC